MLTISHVKQSLSTLLLLGALSISASATESIKLEILEGANVFSKYDDEKPLVANYFTSHTEQEIIDFYKTVYGEISSEERIKERLTVKFLLAEDNIRIIISQQGNKQQVDMLIN